MYRNKNKIHQWVLLILITVWLYACNGSSSENRLFRSSSPYLRQHADNPVNWYEWGEEALELARSQNKPLLISIGYASCHWCHVMEKESFMDNEVALLMNKHFICIKVDREERPDIDNIYMNACQLITGGNGGWPLNAFALPNGKPFFAGTYYTKDSWLNLLKQIAETYKSEFQKVLLQADAITYEIKNIESDFLKNDRQSGTTDKYIYQNFFDSIYTQIDLVHGGLYGEQKFPIPVVWEFLLQYNYYNQDLRAIDAINLSLTKMALGGIYDQAGGGFARYSTDQQWQIPHFEKMLYDNGQLMSLFAHAYQVSKKTLYKNIVEGIALFVERDLTAPSGGFFSSLSATTEDGEGEFYTWSYNDVKKIAGKSSIGMIADYYNITPKGNWKENKNILYATVTAEEFAESQKKSVTEFNELLEKTKTGLLKERNKRMKPVVDDKIITSWNALMMKGYIDAYLVTGKESYLNSALRNAKFIEENLLLKNGQLWRNYSNGKATVDGFLEDYALLAKAFIRLYQATFDIYWLEISRQITDFVIKNFYDEQTGLFYFTSGKADELVVRKIEISDHVIPSSNAVMAEVLFNQYVYFEQKDYLEKARKIVSKIPAKPSRESPYFAHWYYVFGLLANGVNEVAIMGKDAKKRNIELLKNFLPGSITMGSASKEDLPLLKNKMPVNKTLIYVCTNRTCKMPVEEVEKALALIK
jgi:hypothetical protein